MKCALLLLGSEQHTDLFGPTKSPGEKELLELPEGLDMYAFHLVNSTKTILHVQRYQDRV